MENLIFSEFLFNLEDDGNIFFFSKEKKEVLDKITLKKSNSSKNIKEKIIEEG